TAVMMPATFVTVRFTPAPGTSPGRAGEAGGAQGVALHRRIGSPRLPQTGAQRPGRRLRVVGQGERPDHADPAGPGGQHVVEVALVDPADGEPGSGRQIVRRGDPGSVADQVESDRFVVRL